MAPPRPHPLARSGFAARTDSLIAAIWRKGLQPCPPLTPETLWPLGAHGFDKADEVAGRNPEDIEDFRDRLALLCQSLRDEARLNALGHAFAYGQLKAAIRIRHQLGRLWRQRPGIPDTPIAPPIIVVGQMRAGTTRMHRLLAADPAHAGTPFYRSLEPVVPGVDLRKAKVWFTLACARRVNPWLDTLHPFGTTQVDEELPWLGYALNPCALEVQYRIPGYVAASEARDAGAVYREFARILRSDAAQAGDAARPRVLKCPQFAEDLAPLLAQFPDARVVLTQRERPAVLASSVSLVACQMACQTDHADLPAITREWERKLALRDARVDQALAAFGGPVARVGFDALGADWESELEGVYATLGLQFTPAARAAMQAEMGRAERSPHHRHGPIYQEFAQA